MPRQLDTVDPLSTVDEVYCAVAETANLVDLSLDGGGLVYTVRINTDAAQIWVTENVEIAEYMLLGATVLPSSGGSSIRFSLARWLA